MEPYIHDFGVYYVIQTFANKINTKLRNYCQVIPASPDTPSPPSEFQREHFAFYETSNDLLTCVYIYIYIYIYSCNIYTCNIYTCNIYACNIYAIYIYYMCNIYVVYQYI